MVMLPLIEHIVVLDQLSRFNKVVSLLSELETCDDANRRAVLVAKVMDALRPAVNASSCALMHPRF